MKWPTSANFASQPVTDSITDPKTSISHFLLRNSIASLWLTALKTCGWEEMLIAPTARSVGNQAVIIGAKKIEMELDPTGE